jgi:DNA-binding NarL/FixJ family response regulator
MQRVVRVVLADDHQMFREMLHAALPQSGRIEVVGEAQDGQEIRRVAARSAPDIVLLDYDMPQVRSFTALVRQLRAGEYAPQVVVLSGYASDEVALHAAEGGARGYVLKSTRLAAVVDAICTVARGGTWIDPGLNRRVFEIFQRAGSSTEGPREGLSGLTRREHEVLAQVAQGISNDAIARKLCISEQTVKTHLTRIFAKLAVKNRLAAVLAFLDTHTASGGPPPPR